MHIAFHIGAHCTDDDRLVKSLGRNSDRLLEAGVAAPGPGRYRPLLRDTVDGLQGEPANRAVEERVLSDILDGAEPDRLVLSNDSFISVPSRALDERRLYPRMHQAQ